MTTISEMRSLAQYVKGFADGLTNATLSLAADALREAADRLEVGSLGRRDEYDTQEPAELRDKYGIQG